MGILLLYGTGEGDGEDLGALDEMDLWFGAFSFVFFALQISGFIIIYKRVVYPLKSCLNYI